MIVRSLHAASRKVQTLLTRAAKEGPLPDYATFQQSMLPLLMSERSSGMDEVHPSAPPYLAAATTLMRYYHDKLDKGRISPMDLRRYKLLRSLFIDSKRGEQLAQAVLSGPRPEDLTDGSDGLGGAELRFRLLAAMDRGEHAEAGYLLGRLDEDDHDPGERSYLQARAAFAAGNAQRTINLVSAVPSDAIDRPRAAWFGAKAAAQLGDMATLKGFLEEIGGRLSPCAWLHLLELVPPGADRDPGELERLAPKELVIDPADPAYEEWALLHVRMMERYFARVQQLHEAEAAGAPVSEADVVADLASKQFLPALMIEERAAGDRPARDVAQVMYPLVRKGHVVAFRAALELVVAADDRRAAVSLAKRFPSGPGLPWHKDLATLSTIYAAAVSVGDPLHKRLGRLLGGNRLESENGNARRQAIGTGLVPMARISLLAALSELDRVEAAQDRWRDCGLISLGLFRALEVELNARLIHPVSRRIDPTGLRGRLPSGEKPLRAALQELADAGASGHGMMFGPMRNLLAQLNRTEVSDPDTGLVLSELREGFDGLLSRAGRKEDAPHRLAAMIESAVVARFRNPPAHGQFVRLDVALDAARHVEEAIERLKLWLPRPSR